MHGLGVALSDNRRLTTLFSVESQVSEEAADTTLSIVTAAYLVRLLTSSLNSLSGYTHLVIDEVQQRSTDGDIICVLAKRVSSSFSPSGLIRLGGSWLT